MQARVAIVGLDGLPWHLVKRLVEHGVMPNLEKILSHSVRGILESTNPPWTPPAWTSMSSGVNPGKHGVLGFETISERSGTRFMSSNDVRYPRVHEMVALMGLKSVSVNLPLTYPITKMRRTVIVSDWLAPRLVFYPRSVEKFARNFPPYITTHGVSRYLDRIFSRAVQRVNTVNLMMEELDWNLFWVVFSEPDRILHEFYEETLNGNEKSLRVFNKLDESIGKAVEVSDLVFIVSDHGFSKFNRLLSVNTMLYKHGLASKSSKENLEEFTHSRIKAKDRRIERVALPPMLYKIFSSKPLKTLVKMIFRRLTGGKDIRVDLPRIDIKRSLAFHLLHSHGVWVKDSSLIEPICKMLKETRGIEHVWRSEELLSGPYVNLAPQIIFSLDYDNGYQEQLSSRIYPKVMMNHTAYDHHPHGIVIVVGDDVSPNWIHNAKCVDIAPTILNFLKLPLPVDTDGKILHGVASVPESPEYYNYLNHWKLTKRLKKVKT